MAKQIMRKTEISERFVGIYVRLSSEDSRSAESLSIENQKFMLVAHVKSMGWQLKEIYSDEGISYGQKPKSPQTPDFTGFVGF